ncbi:hypothetical protein Tco_0764937 [Tanacetum coccineum]
MDTPMVEKSKLDADPQGKEVDPTRYRGMIGSFMYLTATFADAGHTVCQNTRRSTSGNIFTKALGRERLDFLINKLSKRSMSPEMLKSLADEEDE